MDFNLRLQQHEMILNKNNPIPIIIQ
jgi:hypothetical protein